jgi:UDP-3-O-[3-hydroxymyristoyl] glucosamine N-acyltransferase
MTESVAILVVTLAGTGDDAGWLGEYLGAAPRAVIAVSERMVEDEIRTALVERPGTTQAVVTIDQRFMGFLAKRAIDTLRDERIALPTLVHPSASVAPGVLLGEGVRIAAGAVVSAGCSVGEHARVLERAVLARGCQVGAFSTIDPGALLGESTSVGNHCWLRVGLVVEPRSSVGNSVELGPGGVVRGHVPEGTLHIPGLDAPARIHRFG